VTYSIIYELLDGIKLKMEDLLEPIRTRRSSAGPRFARCTTCRSWRGRGLFGVEGTIKRTAHAALWRENKRSTPGRLPRCAGSKTTCVRWHRASSAASASKGFSDLKPGDIIEAYEIEETRPSLN